jgi:hypothetical protein
MMNFPGLPERSYRLALAREFGRLLRMMRRRRDADVDPANLALEMAMDWDSDWHAPLAPKLRRQMPHLAREAVERIAAECAEAMECGHDIAFSVARDSPDAGADWERQFRSRFCPLYPWVNDANLQRLLRQGMYYAHKTGAARPVLFNTR